ncbi:hypothetical protein MNBD_GAMMA10-2149 [hydrothermal vent metagenome]|uniref:Death on curing protein, Doc toxin n=1 Tax=hydrothermal vent metagenome TaxID=652676 RepID=A0A3B0YKF8_9ZZZZ
MYMQGIKQTLRTISENKSSGRAFSREFPDLLVAKYESHYIFYISENRVKPVIIGIIHEKRDIVNRLSDRLA